MRHLTIILLVCLLALPCAAGWWRPRTERVCKVVLSGKAPRGIHRALVRLQGDGWCEVYDVGWHRIVTFVNLPPCRITACWVNDDGEWQVASKPARYPAKGTQHLILLR